MCFCHQMNKLLSSKGLYHGRPVHLKKGSQAKLLSPNVGEKKASKSFYNGKNR
jgi:hypothetical protein